MPPGLSGRNRPAKKARTDSGSNTDTGSASNNPLSCPTDPLTSSTIDDLTALTTAQLYSLSARRHRDESRESVRRAQEERDRAYVALEQSQRWLERANEHLERTEEGAREAHKEYQDAKNLLARVRQASAAATEMMGGLHAGVRGSIGAAAEAESSDEDEGALGDRRSDSKNRKVPFIEDIIIQLAKSGELNDGKKLSEADIDLVHRRDRSRYAYAMKLVEELWTEEEELFLRSTPEEIRESLEELKIIAETISTRCLTKLNEWEGRADPTPTSHQKPSFITVGTRARRIFVARGLKTKDDED